ncbi:MAG: protein kinase [Blastocatellia bacterium]|nr:protein kinase [Blastocatellia bacterium]
MKIEKYHQIKELFLTAIELPFEERELFVLSIEEQEIRLKVIDMLAAHQAVDSQLDQNLFAKGLELIDEIDISREIDQSSKYRLAEKIGEGGMGSVYKAFHKELVQGKPFAIKLLNQFTSKTSIIKRFRIEAQILGKLDHPYICKLIDIGFTSHSTPYYVMEFIDGQPIDVYCTQNRLSIRKRLELFCLVCQAVQHAHDNAIIHRDLKPANILICKDGHPKLLDFGIAKMLKLDSLESIKSTASKLTKAGEWVMTPAYASPEQFSNSDITTTSDVYSLGVILYKLLTETHPYEFDLSNPLKLAETVNKVDPIKPSSKVKKLSRSIDEPIEKVIDLVVAKAMEKEPSRRYSSAKELEADLQRYLYGLSISIKKPLFSYSFERLYRSDLRSLAPFFLLLLIPAFFYFSRSPNQQSPNSLKTSIEVKDDLFLNLINRLEDVPGTLSLREKELKDYITSLSQNPNSMERANKLGVAYIKLGELQGRPFAAFTIGNTEEALHSYEKAMEIFKNLCLQDPLNPSFKMNYALSKERLAEILARDGESEKALNYFNQTVNIRKNIGLENIENSKALATSYTKIADILVSKGELVTALDQYMKILEIRKRLAEHEPDNLDLKRGLEPIYSRIAITLESLAGLLKEDSQEKKVVSLLYKMALDYDYKLQTLAKEIQSQRPNSPRESLEVASSKLQTASTLFHAGDYKAAIILLNEVTYHFQQVLQTEPNNFDYRRQFIVTRSFLGKAKIGAGEIEEGLTIAEKALEQHYSLSKQDPSNLYIKQDILNTNYELAEQLFRVKQLDSALKKISSALVEYSSLENNYSQTLIFRQYKCLLLKSKILHSLGRSEEAVSIINTALKELPERQIHIQQKILLAAYLQTERFPEEVRSPLEVLRLVNQIQIESISKNQQLLLTYWNVCRKNNQKDLGKEAFEAVIKSLPIDPKNRH